MARYLALLLFGALAAAAPTLPRQTLSCKDASMANSSWTVGGFHYSSSVTYSTPSHRIANGWVNFNLTNYALPLATMSCSATSSQMSDFFYGNQWYQCADSSGNDAEFQFDKSSKRLDLQQRWACVDDVPLMNFLGKGNATVALDCQTERWQNQNWTMGDTYSKEYTNCTPQNLWIEARELLAST
ncbi:hypothetical protein QBC34DRAFT_391941 [Podospora aff. communis PSN243]|uniref:AA1-like domain-containing protein n=1 Tax=Podospora aff. communis PSN243 TaxID=3040156 RepID=A0AAV9H2D7_9PEZI|nr:hypothetical protein QBC34DRAFT_391941 [Podospora aff. communis PSN243]